MSSTDNVETGASDQPTRQTRPRAPTIEIDDTSAAGYQTAFPAEIPTSTLPRLQTESLDHPQPVPSTLPHSPVELHDGRTTSPHNVSSPRTYGMDGAGSNAFLAVPGSRSRALSAESDRSTSTDSKSDSIDEKEEMNKQDTAADNSIIMNDPNALTPDPGTEPDFKVESNPFAYTPGQLNKCINPKSLSAFYALGGLAGLEKGLRTDRLAGLHADEDRLQGAVTFQDVVKTAAHSTDSAYSKSEHVPAQDSTAVVAPTTTSANFSDRKRVFKDNRLPEKKPKSFLQLAWIAYNDKILILLTAAAVISLALGIYQSVRAPTQEEIAAGQHEARIEWVEGVAIVVAILVVTLVGALNDWQKERQFVKLNRKKEERMVRVVRSGRSQELSVYDLLVGDVVHLDPGDLIPVDGIFIAGHNVRCDESSATGESDIIRKTPADEVYSAIQNNRDTKKLDPLSCQAAKSLKVWVPS